MPFIIISYVLIHLSMHYTTTYARAVSLHGISGSLITICVIMTSLLIINMLYISMMPLYIYALPLTTALLMGCAWSSISFLPPQWWTFKDPAENLLVLGLIMTISCQHQIWLSHAMKFQLLGQFSIIAWMVLQIRKFRPSAIIHSASTWQGSYSIALSALLIYNLVLSAFMTFRTFQ